MYLCITELQNGYACRNTIAEDDVELGTKENHHECKIDHSQDGAEDLPSDERDLSRNPGSINLDGEWSEGLWKTMIGPMLGGEHNHIMSF